MQRHQRPILVTLLGVMTVAAAAAEWHQWRGPARDGISSETGLLEQWPEGGPEQVFEVEGLGAGYSSFAFAGDLLFTQGQYDSKQYLMAFNRKTGDMAWEGEHGSIYTDRRGSGPRGTPVIDGDRVYASGGDGNLVCAKHATGDVVWQVNLLDRFGGSNIRWGISESPLIDGDQLVANAGGPGAGVVALNKMTGKLIWKSQSDEAGYSSAIPAEIGGVRMYVLLTGEAAIGVRADNGELLWRYEAVSNRTANIATPIVTGNQVFVSSDYGTGCALLQLNPQGGGVQAEEVYFSRDMRNHYSSSVLVDGYLYGYSSRILTAMKLETGEVAWRDRAVGKGQVIYADGRLYMLGEDGVVGMAKATPEGYQEISRFEIGRGDFPTWTLPAINDGLLYLRDQDVLMAYRIR